MPLLTSLVAFVGAVVTGDYAAAFGFHADGSTPCQNRDDESLVICATTVDIQADLLINGESLSTSRALAETSVSWNRTACHGLTLCNFRVVTLS